MAVTSNIAMAQQPLPTGWNYSAMRDGWDGPNGEFVSKLDVRTHGSFHKAYTYMYGATGGIPTGGLGATGAAGSITRSGTGPMVGDMRQMINGDIEIYCNDGKWHLQSPAINPTSIPNMGIGQGQLSVGSAGAISTYTPQPKNLVLTTSFGPVTLDLEKGYITIPPGIGRDEAIRDFWLAFQEHFQPTNKAEYEKKIKDLENKAEEYGKYATELVTNKIAKKIATKYSGEKFIMVKPDDLIRFIKES